MAIHAYPCKEGRSDLQKDYDVMGSALFDSGER